MRVRFVHLKAEYDITKPMSAPNRPEEIHSWLKVAKKAIPEIPDYRLTTWRIDKWHAIKDEKVVIELWNGEDKHSSKYDFAHIVIDRKASSLG